MTREESIKELRDMKTDPWTDNRQMEALSMGIKALGQEPKTGHWIRQTDDYHDYYECEYCGIAVGLDDIKNFCPNCGCRMVEPQESEDKK